jgi:hypothetical protein
VDKSEEWIERDESFFRRRLFQGTRWALKLCGLRDHPPASAKAAVDATLTFKNLAIIHCLIIAWRFGIVLGDISGTRHAMTCTPTQFGGLLPLARKWFGITGLTYGHGEVNPVALPL